MEIIRRIDEKFLLVMEAVMMLLEQNTDFMTFEQRLKELLNGLGADVLKEVLSELDRKYQTDKTTRPGWEIVRKNDPKTVLTSFGKISYDRTYFYNRAAKKYSYLVDEHVGFTPHMRVEPVVKAELLNLSTQVSYERATEQLSRYDRDLKLSRQTVANTVKEFELKQPEQFRKRKVKNIYIEADEDHVAGLEKGSRFQVRLVYVHEGVVQDNFGGRRKLKNVRYFTGVKSTPEEQWTEVADYICEAYEVEELERIYLSGDGGAWIKSGLEWIPEAIFILDRFHLAKYIVIATAHVPHLRGLVYKGIEAGEKEAVMSTLQQALTEATGEPRKKRITKSISYIANNWDGIQAYYKYDDVVGCSAEGHVSHILSSRMSSRPMGWSKDGAESMPLMLASDYNGVDIEKHYLSSKKPSKLIGLKEEAQKQIKEIKKASAVGKECWGNIPILQSGFSLTREVLAGLKNTMIH
jgi:hypothetical protein